MAFGGCSVRIMASFFDQAPLYNDHPNSSIRDLILMGGEQRARAAQQAGEIWGNAAQNIGNIAAGAVQQYGAKKEEQKQQTQIRLRDAATADAIGRYDPANPKQFLDDMVRIRGPKEGTQMAETVLKFSQNGADKNPETHLKTTHAALGMFLEESPELQAATWGRFKAGLNPTLENLRFPAQLGDQIDDNIRAQLKAAHAALGETLGIKKDVLPKVGTHVVGGNLVDDAGKVLFTAPEKAPKGPAVGSFEDFVTQKYGERPSAGQIASARKEYSAADNVNPQPKVQKVDQFNPETGETETRFITNEDALAMAQGKQPPILKGPSAATKTKMDAARVSINAGENLLAELKDKEFSSKVGSIAGRWNSIAAAAGEGDPTAQYLVSALRSFSAMQPAVHGFRATKMAEDIEKLLSTKQSPEALSGALKGILTASYNVAGKKTPEGSQPGKTIIKRGKDEAGKVFVMYSDGTTGPAE